MVRKCMVGKVLHDDVAIHSAQIARAYSTYVLDTIIYELMQLAGCNN